MSEVQTQFVLGVDGGQTTTKCVLATTEGQVLGRGEGGGLIHLAEDRGREHLERALREAFAGAWSSAGLEPREVQALGLGLTGVEAGTPEARRVHELLPSLVRAERVDVQSDAVAALMGAHAGQPGVIVVAGTGSIALGLDPQGRPARAGGWGWLVGDEGSAFAIGRGGLHSVFDALDGTGPATGLEPILLRHFQVDAVRDLKRRVNATDFGPRGFGALAPLVAQAAEQGDAVAAGIIREAGRALAAQVCAVIRRLNFDQPACVAPIGGAFEHVAGLRQAFETAMNLASVPAIIVEPKLPPVLGAVILALRLCRGDLDSALARLETSAWRLTARPQPHGDKSTVLKGHAP